MTNREMIREVKKPGPVLVPVLIKEDVMHMEVVKADLLWRLKRRPPDGPSPWDHFSRDEENGSLWIS